MGNSVDKFTDHIVKHSVPEDSKSHNEHLNLLELTRHFAKGVVEGAAKPIEGVAQMVTGSKIGAVDETKKDKGLNAKAEHLGEYAGEAFDYLVAMRIGKGALGAAEKHFGFEAASKLGPRGTLFAEKALSISAGGVTGFLQPTQDGGLDLKHRGKAAFLGAASTGLFEGSSSILRTSGLAGSVYKDGAKVFASSFVAGGATAELQSRINYKQDASLQDVLTAGAMWGATGAALHFGGKVVTSHHPEAAAAVTEPAKVAEMTEAFAAFAEKPSVFAEMSSEMAKTVAEASAMKKHDEAELRVGRRVLHGT